MAEGMSLEEAAQKPGIGMRITISMLKKKFPSVDNISTEALSRKFNDSTLLQENKNNSDKQDGNLILLDCRPEEEYIVSRIPESLRVDHNWSVDKIVQNLTQVNKNIRDKDSIVCYCSVGYRSCVVAEKLQQFYKRKNVTESSQNKCVPSVYNLEGSLFKWANERRKMVDSKDQPTPYAHPYNAVFGKLLDNHLRKTNS